jgi:hypothetical protein
VFVEQALQALDGELQPELLVGGGWLAPEGGPFESRLLVGSDVLESGAYRLVLCLEGQVGVQGPQMSAVLGPGEAALLLAADPAARVEAAGMAALVRQA